ncbi:putative WW domain-containing protein [Helianthus annuus]|uniref:formin-binding protein 4 isoform X6 n=1 Tax=Helianthus annuus TaxID=4232 RepID=UPI000B903C26|nr:formin-binding protein 4 isoform X6 [Helianthus annuus]KAJ0500937.1 putative WW domain-containing protein [Helianthus annuus]KAJ0516829.1 putative WW domain-containing protein [Helianthus annuus]KAJ0684834.1 putative WW domain-containing protein [Helianthus annuus]KAJ0688761.1 putative WW domain-containing protein [Helianthus annuus]
MLCCTQSFNMPTRLVVHRKPENPLLLLGQYSDEEGEEESSKEVNHGARENTPTVLDEQVKVDNHDSTGADVDEKLLTEKVDQEKKPYPVDVLPNLEKTVEDDKPEPLHRDTDTLDRASVSLTSEMQTTGDVDSGWKMVLHEESNSYYYWNVATGETSWETPDVLTRGNESAYDPKSVPEIEETHATYVDAQANNECTNGVTFEAKENDNSGIELNVHNGNYTDIMANDIDEGVATQACDGLSNVEAHRNDSVFQDMGCHGGESSDAFRLLELCESLSERLKSLEGPEGFGDQISKLKFELDIRLADIKSLVPYGSSLLPFWLHSENQLKNLESSINNEVLKHLQRTSSGEINDPKTRFLENIGEYHENQVPTDIDPNAGHHSVEDEDMDVEMEVEDTAIHSKDKADPQNGSHLDQSVSPILHEHLDSRGSEQPLPPNDEWIPPPPPDEEPFPPPPPDEPPEAPPQPSDMQTTQPYSYGEQYSFTYPGSGFDYYGQTNTAISSNGYYVDANGSHIPAPLPNVYYAPVLNPETATYYTLQDGMISTVPAVSGVETSLQSSVYGNIISDPIKSSTVVSSVSASSHVPESSSVTHGVSVVSASSVASTETVPKVQPKVTRIKKRTVAAVPTLRSNKKVSGLVDKWKAVKEELHEDEEDEPENALEILEKKRQREIEQWHAQQIASGEAKDNANFQPLGGDWRERVRRKRAKKSTQAEENLATNATDETKQQPNLAEISKQLPTGWQAYWDESSKQVYYGNSKTSETTWTKPTK